ncbi:hypothetical protein LTR08_008825 [Meristemomyces frigidus]|nr:hypothetical protein LTR08_008825 [Meristemomyces frigidus]
MQLTTILAGVLGLMATSVLAAPAPASIGAALAAISSQSSATTSADASTYAPAPFRYSEDAQKVHDIIKAMKTDPMGQFHLADDGVARSYGANGTVIDFRPLTNAQLLEFFNSYPPTASGKSNHAHYLEVFQNVNGHDAAGNLEQMWNPPAHFAYVLTLLSY